MQGALKQDGSSNQCNSIEITELASKSTDVEQLIELVPVYSSNTNLKCSNSVVNLKKFNILSFSSSVNHKQSRAQNEHFCKYLSKTLFSS